MSTEDDPIITVGIATFNRSAYLREAIDSVLAQQGVSFQVFVSDDHSSDDTIDLLRSYADPRLSYTIQPVNLGWHANSGAALIHGRTRYVTLLGDDDRMKPGALERAVSVLERQPRVGLVHAAIDIIDDDGAVVSKNVDWTGDLTASTTEQGRDFIAKSMLMPCRVCSPTVVLRRDAVPSPPFLNSDGPAGDVGCWIRVARDHEVHFLDVPAVEYRVHRGSDSSRWSTMEGDRYIASAAAKSLRKKVRGMKLTFLHEDGIAPADRLRWTAAANYVYGRGVVGDVVYRR